MTVPLSFEPKSKGTMQQPPRNPHQALLSGSLLKRIILISVFNWILIFGVFEWTKSTTGDLAIARTMAIQALVAARVFYLLSISEMGQLSLSLNPFKNIRLNETRAIAIGIIGTIFLQIIFSQWSIMNQLFYTAPLSVNQWLLCLLIGLPMIPVSLLANRLDPYSV
jgi:cation-transporting P-type ATPase F